MGSDMLLQDFSHAVGSESSDDLDVHLCQTKRPETRSFAGDIETTVIGVTALGKERKPSRVDLVRWAPAGAEEVMEPQRVRAAEGESARQAS